MFFLEKLAGALLYQEKEHDSKKKSMAEFCILILHIKFGI
jgi:hypothetical protein